MTGLAHLAGAPPAASAYPTSTHTLETSSSSPSLPTDDSWTVGVMPSLELAPASPPSSNVLLAPQTFALKALPSPLPPSATGSRTALLVPGTPSEAAMVPERTPAAAGKWSRILHRHHTQALIDKEAATRARTDWLSAVFATGTGGGKLVAAVGASSLGLFVGNHLSNEAALGSALVTFGALIAVAAALIAFGPYVKRNYPDNAVILKTVSISSAALMIGGNVAAGYAAATGVRPIKIGGCTVYALGNAAMSISFRNFVAVSELERGRMFTRWRRTSSWMMLAAGLASLLAINVVRPSDEFAQGTRAALMLIAGACLVAGVAWPRAPVSPNICRHPNYARQALCAIGIGATMGLSAGDPSLPLTSHLKSLALTLCSSPLFGALAVDESERLRIEIQAQAAASELTGSLS